MLSNCGAGEDSWDSKIKQIKPVNPKGNQPWILIGRTDAETQAPTLATWCEELTHWKRPWCWERLRAGEEGNRGWDGWMASRTHWAWVWASSRRWQRTGKPGVLRSMGLQRVGYNWATQQQQQPTIMGFPCGTSGKEPNCLKRHGFNPRVGKILCRRAPQPTPVCLPRESHGQRTLAGQSIGS